MKLLFLLLLLASTVLAGMIDSPDKALKMLKENKADLRQIHRLLKMVPQADRQVHQPILKYPSRQLRALIQPPHALVSPLS
jgi:2,4-dienoyl-CoA reductase-like NADH-dependent reductase (Old Yellow Enzyme family)